MPRILYKTTIRELRAKINEMAVLTKPITNKVSSQEEIEIAENILTAIFKGNTGVAMKIMRANYPFDLNEVMDAVLANDDFSDDLKEQAVALLKKFKK